ncbi:MAG: flagellar biosynthesis protein [Candidatus Omnitrophica bacterium]|nr:flagellar biosynthesis protein [Candidatus Omnitrophota bacterium]
MSRLAKFYFLISFVLLSTGCATNRGFLGIDVPAGSLTVPNGKQVYIRSITDNRQFQDKPSTPDIPSLGFDSLKEATADIKNRAMARKRNSYGKAMGDILLEEGQSVQGVIYQATRNSLFSLGYAVVSKEEEARPDAIILDISIDKFWGWLEPGFWAISLKSEITTTNTITMPKQDSPILIKATAKNTCQVGSEANWKKVFRLVIDDFIEKAKIELKNLDTNN